MSDDKKTGVREQASALREDLAPDRIEQKLSEVIEERPKAKHLLDFTIVGKAVLAAVVVALILWLIFSPQLAAVALVVVFLGAWLGGAQLSYDKRRETHDARAQGRVACAAHELRPRPGDRVVERRRRLGQADLIPELPERVLLGDREREGLVIPEALEPQEGQPQRGAGCGDGAKQ